MFGGISRFDSKVLSIVTSRYKHCCTSSKDVIEFLKVSEVDQHTVLAKLDIKDFYMDSIHSECLDSSRQALQNILSSGIELPFVKEDCCFDLVAFQDALAFLLRHQYVDPDIEHIVYEVVCGSGMGSDHSAGLSSINFFEQVEKHIFDSSGVLSMRSSIQIYCRYHDDILIALRNEEEAKFALSEICKYSGSSYKLELDHVSLNGVSMLDLFVFRSINVFESRRLSFKPFIKPSAQHIPLGSDSEQPRHVHTSWPISEISRMHRLSQHPQGFKEFKQRKLARFLEFVCQARF